MAQQPVDPETKRRVVATLTGCYSVMFGIMFVLLICVVAVIRWRFPEIADGGNDAIAIAITIGTGCFGFQVLAGETRKLLQTEFDELKQEALVHIAELTRECERLSSRIDELERIEHARSATRFPAIRRWLSQHASRRSAES